MNEKEVMEILQKTLECSKADDVVATLGGNRTATTRLADNLITQNVVKNDTVLQVTAAFGNRHGSATTNTLSDDGIRAAVLRAEKIAALSPSDPEYMPPVDAGYAKKYAAGKTYFPDVEALAPDTKAGLLAAACSETAQSGMRLSGSYTNGARIRAVANSRGLAAFSQSTRAGINATVLSETSSGWAQRTSNTTGDVRVDEVVGEARRIAEASRVPKDIAPGKYTLIMSPEALAELLMFLFYLGFDAKATDEGRTCMRGKLGKRICGENVTIRSRPAEPDCPGAPFGAADGFPAADLNWIRNGVLENLIYSRYWADRQKKQPTGEPSNLIMDGGGASVDEMIKSTGRGLLVTRFWYVRFVDPMVPSVTGMTRDGLFLIENGKVTGAVRQLRFNEDILGMLGRIEMLGPCQRTGVFSESYVPTVKVRDFNFTSGTKF